MFHNIGGKIKALAKICTWIGIVSSILFGSFVIFESGFDETFFMGLLIIILGPLSSWIGSFLLYGFGQLIENSDKIARSLESKGK